MEVVDYISKDANVIGTKWVFIKKENGMKKAKLVVFGCQQIPNEDFM